MGVGVGVGVGVGGTGVGVAIGGVGVAITCVGGNDVGASDGALPPHAAISTPANPRIPGK